MVKLYIESLKMNIKTKIEYKASFIINTLSQFAVFFSYYFTILALFNNFSNVKGYTMYEVLLCFSIVHFGYAFNEVFFRGIDKFERLIINGSLDRYLVRPRGILFQTMCADTDLVKLARCAQALIIMFISLNKLHIIWNISKVITLIFMLISSVVIFFSIFVLMASYCFVTVQGLEVKNLLTDGGKFLAKYPISIYGKKIAFVFTFIIPFGFMNYYPLLYFLGRNNNPIYMVSPLIVLLFMVPCVVLFHVGLKRYGSTGS